MSLFATQAEAAVDSLQLIPRPVSVTYGTGTLRLPRTLPSLRWSTRLPQRRTQEAVLHHDRCQGPYEGSHHDPSRCLRPQASEGYRLEIGKQGITLTARDEAGLRQGTQSLLQITQPRTEEPYPTSPSPTQHAWPTRGDARRLASLHEPRYDHPSPG